ncbi:integrin alpha-4-like [Helicoverpa zea]|uniref:integrin alpha-4-like n=1 Tax=Helicoverpa zea TaxID=7113 RepID=UPI001F59B560|nr:integrin alpha-4-like [Helicoverpa zea]
MNFHIWVMLALAAWPNVQAIYFTGVREVFGPPRALRENSYFGYSITYDEYYKKLVISAPRENDIGEVYDCDIEKRKCEPIFRNITRYSSSYTHDYWFGATVKAGRDFVMMCAPRYTQHYIRFNSWVTWGKCFQHSKGKLNEKPTILENERIMDSPSPMEATMDSFGWSIDVASDDSIIIGGPGMFHGRAMVYKPHKNVPIFMKKSQITPEFNFGYSVASGTFINHKMFYAVSSTYGYGEVQFFENVLFKGKLNKKEDYDKVGTMFGAVLCAAKLTTGSKTDLLVGAPAFGTNSEDNLGAVYVFLAGKLDYPPTFSKKLVGQPGAQFGSAIINLGDLNGDKCDEIAIGAPFENSGEGAVYIYSGADLGSPQKMVNQLQYLQKITPEASYAKSFGMSLTPLLDYDQNGCKELAIGSPFVNSVLLLRCIASVTVTTNVEFPNLQNRSMSHQTNFEFDLCLIIDYPTLPEKVIALLSTTVEMTHSEAHLVANSPAGFYTFTTALNERKREYCKKVLFILPLHGHYETDIQYQITTRLLNDPRNLKDFNSSRVILSDKSILNIQDSVWAAECSGKICVPRLRIEHSISFQYHDHEYIMGSSEVESIKITVYNDGEAAYNPCVRINIVGVPIFKHPYSCELDKSVSGVLVCKPPHPLLYGQTWETSEILLETKSLTSLVRQVVFDLQLLNDCKKTDEYAKMMVAVPVRAEGIAVKGETDIGSYVNMTEQDIKENGKILQHVYSITNTGKSNWMEVHCTVILQILPHIRYEENPVKLYWSKDVPPTACGLQSTDERKMKYLCTIPSLLPNRQPAKIFIPMFIVPKTLDGIVKDTSNATIMSIIHVKLIDNILEESVLTTIMLQEAKVPLELIVIAVCVGIFLLFIIAVILYRVGFLRRQKKEELRRLKNRVKRQTILRQSMHGSADQKECQSKEGVENAGLMVEAK